MASPLPQAPQVPHVLIIGAGITGLILAQAIKRHNINCTVFERDLSPSSRGSGWGLTIHWALDTFLSLLPKTIIDRLPECYVDPVAVEEGEESNFLFFDLRSGEARWQVPAARRIRPQLRIFLVVPPPLQYILSIPQHSNGLFHPPFFRLRLRYRIPPHRRRRLPLGRPLPPPLTQLIPSGPYPPSRSLPGRDCHLPPSLALRARSLDPFFFQGGDPATDTFLYFSFLSTPSKSERESGRGDWECQLIISYPYRAGFWGKEEVMEVPDSDEGRVQLMKAFAEGWAEPFRGMVMGIDDGMGVKSLGVEDWVPRVGMWDNRGGRVTLVGYAGHAMTIYRGEAANHGIIDVSALLSHILPLFQTPPPTSPTERKTEAAISAYEKELIARTAPAVLTSRRACLDAHDYKRIDDRSPLVSRRAIVFEES